MKTFMEVLTEEFNRTFRDIPPPDEPLDFSLTPRERDGAKIIELHLERNRREQNRRDALRARAPRPSGDSPEAA